MQVDTRAGRAMLICQSLSNTELAFRRQTTGSRCSRQSSTFYTMKGRTANLR